MADLEIRNLHVQAGDKKILKGLDLEVSKGEIHALMGPNGSGKSTLANTLMGNPSYEVTEGRILLNREDLTEADPDERARAGLFMAFQYPATIPGVSVANFLRMAVNARREEPIKVKEFGAMLADQGFAQQGGDAAHVRAEFGGEICLGIHCSVSHGNYLSSVRLWLVHCAGYCEPGYCSYGMLPAAGRSPGICLRCCTALEPSIRPLYEDTASGTRPPGSGRNGPQHLGYAGRPSRGSHPSLQRAGRHWKGPPAE